MRFIEVEFGVYWTYQTTIDMSGQQKQPATTGRISDCDSLSCNSTLYTEISEKLLKTTDTDAT